MRDDQVMMYLFITPLLIALWALVCLFCYSIYRIIKDH